MSDKGGYQIIDLQMKNITVGSPNSVHIPGIYDLILGTDKPYLISGVVVDNVEYEDRFCSIDKSQDAVLFIQFDNNFNIRVLYSDDVYIR